MLELDLHAGFANAVKKKINANAVLAWSAGPAWRFSIQKHYYVRSYRSLYVV